MESKTLPSAAGRTEKCHTKWVEARYTGTKPPRSAATFLGKDPQPYSSHGSLNLDKIAQYPAKPTL